jgi:hypothetical protein
MQIHKFSADLEIADKTSYVHGIDEPLRAPRVRRDSPESFVDFLFVRRKR